MRFRFLLLGLLAGALLASCQNSQPAATDAIPTPEITKGSYVEPPRKLSDFTLQNSAGGTISLSSLRGKPLLLFFGYTHCPDVCPTTLVDLRDAVDMLGDKASDVQVAFVSVDGARDTPDTLRAYLDNFNPSFIGMTGDEASLRKLGVDYGLFFARRDIQGTAAGYLVDHSASTYLIDADGNLRVLFPFGTPPAVYAKEVEALLQ